MKQKTNPYFKKWFFLVTLLLITSGVFIFVTKTNSSPSNNSFSQIFTSSQLQKYDGSQPEMPVYLAYDGYVYDVSSGREDFYGPGKPYHHLAGRDSTDLLKIAGGDIIVRKYPVVGTFIP